MKTTRRILAAATLAVATMVSGFGQMAYNCEGCPPLLERDTVFLSDVVDVEGDLPANYMMTCENLYILDQKVYVTVGSQVTILAGTVIKATYEGELNSAAFIVPRGAKIFANGSECCPIIFTSVEDDLDGTFPIYTKERWGGLLVLGYAHNTLAINELNPENPTFVIGGQTNGIGFIEGVDPADPRHWYGAEIDLGTPFQNFDNSGIMNYVSIRHGGSELGTANEINGLTLGSVGSGTVLRNIEVVSNGDDGIEFFGGTVDLKYARILYCEDDYIDWDQGYTGRIQHVLGVTRPEGATGGVGLGDNGFECDGDDGTDFPRGWWTDPIVSNVTMLGRSSDKGLELKERTKGEIYNSILANYGTGIKYNNASEDTVVIKNSTFVNNTTQVSGTPVAGLEPTDAAFNNTFVASLAGMTTSNWTTVWDAIPSATAAALDVKGLADDPAKIAAGWYNANYYNWFDAVDYQGAFKPGATPWWSMENCSMLQSVRADFESLSFFPAITDLNGDGVTNAADLSLIIGRYNKANDE